MFFQNLSVYRKWVGRAKSNPSSFCLTIEIFMKNRCRRNESSVRTNLFLNHFEDIFYQVPIKPILYDAILTSSWNYPIKKLKIFSLFDFVNSIHLNISFTIDVIYSNILLFLNIKITRQYYYIPANWKTHTIISFMYLMYIKYKTNIFLSWFK